jgi:hypothetical protein
MSTIHDSDRDGEALRHAPYVAREEVASTSPVQDSHPSLAQRRETARPVSREDLPSLADRTEALVSILEGLTYGLPITVDVDYFDTETNVSMQHGNHSLDARLTRDTLDVHITRDGTAERTMPVVAALNTMHAWITDTLGATTANI